MNLLLHFFKLFLLCLTYFKTEEKKLDYIYSTSVCKIRKICDLILQVFENKPLPSLYAEDKNRLIFLQVILMLMPI